ncbi:type VII secretion integral membrane protein EccD [Alteromonas gracilis]
MSIVDASAFTRVHIVAPHTRLDVSLPADVPLADLLPMVLEMVGERSDDDESTYGGWALSRVDGQQLTPDRTLHQLDLLDGAVLRLFPRAGEVERPYFDDVVDAVAETVRKEMFTGDLRHQVSAGMITTGLLATAVLFWATEPGILSAVAAGLVAVLMVLVSGFLARTAANPGLGVATGSANVAVCFVAGTLAFDDRWGWPALLLGAALALGGAAAAYAATGSGVRSFSALQTVALAWIVGGLIGLLFDLELGAVAAGIAAFGVMSMTALPWASMHLARLPAPTIPMTSEELRTLPDPDFAAITRRASLASGYLNGTLIGCSAIAGLGAVAALASGGNGIWTPIFAVVVVAAVLMRVRLVADAMPRVAMVVIGMISIALMVAGIVMDDEQTMGLAAPVVAAIVVLVLATSAAAGSRQRMSPTTARSIDILEGLLIAAVLPLAFASMNLFSFFRHL